jgi:hypothetical protein
MEPRTSLRFDAGKNLACIKMSGPLSGPAILSAFDAAVDSPEYRPGMARLWDFTEADPSSLDSETLRQMALHSLRFPPGVRDVRVAFVAPTDLGFGLARMFEAFSDGVAAITPRVFHTRDEAEAWLGGSPAR